MDAQFSLTRTWLVFVLLYNSAQCLNAGATMVLLIVGDRIVSTADDSAFQEAGVNRETVELTFQFGKFFAIGMGAARIASVAILVWLFWWRKAAFWAYCTSVAINFVFCLWSGDSFWMAGIDVLGLAGLLTLMIRIEPGSWELLD